MGIQITYRGSLRDPDCVDVLVADMQGLAQRMGWPVWTYDELVEMGAVLPTGLRGVTLQPHPRCEALHLHFDEAGHFVNHFYHALVHDAGRFKQVFDMLRENQRQIEALELFDGDPAPARPDVADGQNGETGPKLQFVSVDPGAIYLEEGIRYNWIKTQRGGASAHVAVCEVLDHVKACYAPDLKIGDDSGYFEHRDLKQLEVRLAEVDFLIDRFMAAAHRLAEEGTSTPATPTEIIDKLKQYFDEARQRLH